MKRIDWWEFQHRWKWRLYDTVTLPRRGYRRLAHICAWLPVLWRDHDFQESFLVDIVIFKLRRMGKSLETYHHHPNWERNVRECRVAAAWLERYRDPYARVPHPKETPMTFEERMKQLDRPEWKLWCNRVRHVEQEGWDRAWELIKKKGQYWWD